MIKVLQVLIALALLGGWYLASEAADSMVPAGSEYQMWSPLQDDLRALNLTSAKVRASVYDLEFDRNFTPLHARYVLRGVDGAHLNVATSWQAQGVPARPASHRSGLFGRTRPGVADNCPQELAKTVFWGRAVENAVLTWQETTSQGHRQARLTVWRETPGWAPSLTGRLVCVESSRTLPVP